MGATSHDDLGALRTLTSRLERAALEPPADLQGAARELFVALASGNATRGWNVSHAFALSDYCRLSVLWSEQIGLIETEGAQVGAKPNNRFATLRALSMERNRLARLLGLAVGAGDGNLPKTATNNPRFRALAESMQDARDRDVDGYLS